MPPLVCISIVNWNQEKLLVHCLESIFETTEYSNFEVVVVDNNSSDGSVVRVKNEYPDVTVIQNSKNVGFSIAHNKAFKLAIQRNAEYVVVLNNDVEVVESEWLTELVGVAESDADIGAVACRINAPNGEISYDGRYFPRSDIFFPYSSVVSVYQYNKFERDNDADYEFVDEAHGACLLISSKAIDDLGGFDVAYSPLYFEESDLSVRLWDAGFKLAYTDNTSVCHIEGASTHELDQAYINYVVFTNKVRFVLVNYPVEWIALYLPMMVFQPLTILFASKGTLFSRQATVASRMSYYIRSYKSLLSIAFEAVSKRKRRSDVKELLK